MGSDPYIKHLQLNCDTTKSIKDLCGKSNRQLLNRNYNKQELKKNVIDKKYNFQYKRKF